MKPYNFTFFIALVLILPLASCVTNKKAVYFRSEDDTTRFFQENITNTYEPKIAPDDILAITVSSPYSGLANDNTGNALNTPVNSINLATATNSSVFSVNPNLTNNSNIPVGGYRVDADGNIEFPLAGKIKLGGLTTAQAKDTVQQVVSKYQKDPVVDIRFLNYKITVLGEVLHPSTFTVPNERVTLLDALGMAGDMTIYGKRDNVLVIREENGKRTMARVDLNSKDVFESPYFYLHQGDVVYVEPNKSKLASTDAALRYLPYLTVIVTAVYTGVLIWNVSKK